MDVSEYASIYWAAAYLVLWAGSGTYVTEVQLNDAINSVCDKAKLTPSQEGLLKSIVHKLLEKGL